MRPTLGLTLAALAVASAAPARGDGPTRPNLVLLFADDQRADTIAAWGNPHIRTPNLDRLVARGTSFRGNYCFGSNSGAVCVPSRAMLLSGRTWLDVPHDLQGVATLPEALRGAGYDTFAVGKWHNGEASLARAFPEAGSIFLGGMADHTKVPIADVRGGAIVDRRVAPKFSSEQFADAAVGFLRSREGEDDPFFLYVAFTASHDPRDPPEPYRRWYYDHRPPAPANFLPQPTFDNGITKDVRDENLAPYPRTPEVIREQLCEYYGLITHMDEQVGRILDALEAAGHAEDTVVIYAADHGLALGSHGLLGKQSLYEHSMRSPLIVAGPGIPGGRSTGAFTYLFDLVPTICDLAGAEPPGGLAGRSLRPLWDDPDARLRDSVFLPFSDLMRSVRDDRWKLIVYPPIDHRELFDLAEDPGETRNLADDPAHAAEVARLTALLEGWQARVGDRQPLAVEHPRPKAIRFDDYVRRPDPWQPGWIVEKYFDPPAP
jgi:arylsulfatase A-like enzyme